jgi:hypothetical protein
VPKAVTEDEDKHYKDELTALAKEDEDKQYNDELTALSKEDGDKHYNDELVRHCSVCLHLLAQSCQFVIALFVFIFCAQSCQFVIVVFVFILLWPKKTTTNNAMTN